jgi:hypothetical protein
LSTVTGALNIGIFHWRPTEPAKRLAKDWKDLVLSDDKLWDQNAFNDLVRKVFGQPVEGQGDLVYSYDGKLKLGILPASIFCSGHTYFVQVGVYFFCLQLPIGNSVVETFFLLDHSCILFFRCPFFLLFGYFCIPLLVFSPCLQLCS